MYNTISPNKTVSSLNLICYLEKENQSSYKFVEYLDKEVKIEEVKAFFNESEFFSQGEVVNGIDKNCKGLTKKEPRFFSLTFNPSQGEISHLKTLAEELTNDLLENDVDGIISKSKDELLEEMMHHLLQDYTKKAMNIYAQTFNRPGINDSSDLVWFGRVETHRYWKDSEKAFGSDAVRKNERITKEVIKLKSLRKFKEAYDLTSDYVLEKDLVPGGRHLPVRNMMEKCGDNFHVHVIVSRKDKTQKIRLSPLSKEKGNNNHIVNGRECQIGFFRNGYTENLEQAFDRNFGYERAEEEKFQYLKAKKLERNKIEHDRSPDLEIVDKIKNLYSKENNILILSKEERDYLHEVAVLKRKYDTSTYPGAIDREVEKMIKGYDFHGAVVVPDIGKDIDSVHIRILDSKILSKADHSVIDKIAKLKVTTRLGLSDSKEFKSALGREKYSIQDRYYLTGQIVVPKGIDTSKLDSKFIITDLPPITQKDYSLINQFLEKKIEERWPDLNEKKIESKLKVEFSKLENKYYRTGELIAPFAGGSLIDLAIEGGTFEVYNYEEIKGAAEREVDISFAKNLSDDQREIEIEKIINRHTIDFKENQYKHLRELAASNADASLIVQNAVGGHLTQVDYELFKGAAEREVNFRFPHDISENQREIEIEKIINRHEINHYSKGYLTISRDIYLEEEFSFNISEKHLIPVDVSKKIKEVANDRVTRRLGGEVENKRIVETEEYFLSLEYMEVEKLTIPQEVFSVEEFNDIRKVAEHKVGGIHSADSLTKKEFESKVYREIQKMENEFQYSGKIYCPNEFDSLDKNIFIRSQVPALNTLQYDEIMSVATQTEILKLDELDTDKSLNLKIVSKKVEKLISEYYSNGEIRIPENIQATGIFNPNLSKILSKEEYGLLEKTANEIIENRYPGIDVKFSNLLATRKLNEFERQYYYYDSGVTIPKSEVLIDNPKISFSERAVLSKEDYSTLYKAADENIKNGSPIDREEYVSIYEGRYNSDKDIVLQKGDYELKCYYSENNTKFSQSIIDPLKKEDYSILNVIAEKEVGIRFSKDINEKKRDIEIKKIIIRAEDQYLESGEIKVPDVIWNNKYSKNPIFIHSDDLIIPYEKSIEIKEIAINNLTLRMGDDYSKELLYREEFILSQKYINGQELETPEAGSLLSKEDFKAMKGIAEHKSKVLFPEGTISLKERNIGIYKEILKQEKAFQYNGKMFVPNDLPLPIGNEKFVSSPAATLTAEKYAEIVKVATGIENAHIPNKPNLDNYNIDYRASRMVNEYYSSGEILIPMNIQASSMFNPELSNTLTGEEYGLFEKIANNIVENRYGSLDDKQKKRFVSKKLNEYERQYYYYDKGVTIPKSEVQIDNPKILFSKRAVLSNEDYSILYKAADDNIKNGSPIDREEYVSRYEGRYNSGKDIILPKGDYKQNTQFSQSIIEPLKKKDYSTLSVIAEKEVAIRFEKDIDDERKAAEINKIIIRSEEQYLQTGEIKVPDAIWDNQYSKNPIFKQSDDLIIPYEKSIEIKEIAINNLTLKMGDDYPKELLHREEFILSQKFLKGQELGDPELGSLSKEEFKVMRSIAEHKVDTIYPYGNLSPKERSSGIYEKVLLMEKEFQYNGKMFVPNDLPLPIDNGKFVSSPAATLTAEKYSEMLKIASKIERSHLKDKRHVDDKKVFFRVQRMESEYYGTGKIKIPRNIEASQMFTPNLSQSLSHKEFALFEKTANEIIKNRYPGIDQDKKERLVSQKANEFARQYYEKNGVIIPDIGESSINKQIRINNGKLLTKTDYEVLYKAAEINIKNGSPIDREEYVSRYERRYNSNSPKQIILPTGEYGALSRFKECGLTPLDSRDYKIMIDTANKMADGKEFVNNKDRERFITNKVSNMEYSYWNTKHIIIPFSEEKSPKFKELNVPFLTKQDYMYFEASAKNYLKKQNIPITKEEVNQLVGKYEYTYYKHGSVTIGIYRGENKNIKEFQKGIGNVPSKLINIATNFATKDLPETREIANTSRKGVSVYRSVKTVQRARSAAKLAVSVTKSITIRAITTAIPYVGVVISAADILLGGAKGRDR